MEGHVYVVEVEFRDGRRTHPVLIRKGAPDWERHLDAAVEHFEALHRGEATVTVLYGRTPYALGVADPVLVPEWKDYRP